VARIVGRVGSGWQQAVENKRGERRSCQYVEGEVRLHAVQTINTSIGQSQPQDAGRTDHDFTPIGVGELPFALAVNPKLPVSSTRELLDYAKANPGKISYATPNSTSLVASETIKNQAKVDIVGVQYKSSPQALTDLVGGQLEMYVVDLGSGLATLKSGKVKTLAVTPARGTKILLACRRSRMRCRA
jgi:tripartite-type tricarboxylate transporter receptor subunit TctC